MKAIVLLLALLASALVFEAKSAQAIAIINFGPDTYAYGTSPFEVNIFADVPSSEALLTWGFKLQYDSSLIKLNSITVGTDWVPFMSDPNPNSNYLAGFYMPTNPELSAPGLSGTGLLLATVNFNFVNPGDGKAQIGVSVDPNDLSQGFTTFDSTTINFQTTKWETFDWSTFDATFNNDWSVTPDSGIIEQGTPVPETCTILSLCLGLVGVAWFSRKSRKSFARCTF